MNLHIPPAMGSIVALIFFFSYLDDFGIKLPIKVDIQLNKGKKKKKKSTHISEY